MHVAGKKNEKNIEISHFIMTRAALESKRDGKKSAGVEWKAENKKQRTERKEKA